MSEPLSASQQYRAIAVGALDIPRGRNRRPQLRMSGPFGGDFSLPLRLLYQAPGYELLDRSYNGARLVIDGCLEWSAGIDDASPIPAMNVAAIRPSTAQEQDGCDVWLSGEVATPTRISRHPLRSSVALAQLAVRVQIPRMRPGSRMSFVETARIPLVIPLNHGDAPALLRPGNRVSVEGMLERVPLPKGGAEVEGALAELEKTLHERLAHTTDSAETRIIERAAARRRWELTHAAGSRVIAGYVQLLEGAPASIREARAIRRASLPRRT